MKMKTTSALPGRRLALLSGAGLLALTVDVSSAAIPAMPDSGSAPSAYLQLAEPRGGNPPSKAPVRGSSAELYGGSSADRYGGSSADRSGVAGPRDRRTMGKPRARERDNAGNRREDDQDQDRQEQ